MRFYLLAFALVATLVATKSARGSLPAGNRLAANPCQIQGQNFDSAAFQRFRLVLTDTGDTGTEFAALRDTAGITGVHMGDLVVVQDTVRCRAVLNTMKSFYAGRGGSFATTVNNLEGGLLVRFSPNRYVMAVAVFHPQTLATLFVADSNAVMVLPFL